MPKKGRAKVRVTLRQIFRASVWRVTDAEGGGYAYLDVNSPRLKNKAWRDGDKVRVTVELLRRDAATKKGSK